MRHVGLTEHLSQRIESGMTTYREAARRILTSDHMKPGPGRWLSSCFAISRGLLDWYRSGRRSLHRPSGWPAAASRDSGSPSGLRGNIGKESRHRSRGPGQRGLRSRRCIAKAAERRRHARRRPRIHPHEARFAAIVSAARSGLCGATLANSRVDATSRDVRSQDWRRLALSA